MKYSSILMISLLLFFMPFTNMNVTLAQERTNSYRIYNAAGKPSTLQEVIEAMNTAQVVFIGEIHNSPTAHQLEAELLQGAYKRFGPATEKTPARPIVLSLEMFERDVQVVLNEYLAGLILERQFLAASRPWSNYQTDYRPLVEFARAHRVPVLAANAPERYVNRVGRLGRDSLNALTPVSKSWLAPLPYGTASAAYAAKFRQFMQGESGRHGAHASPHLLDAQLLRDATMGYALAEQLKEKPTALVIHVTGNFHSEGRLGTPEQLLSYRPGTKLMVVTMLPAGASVKLDGENLGRLGDFIILMEGNSSRSF